MTEGQFADDASATSFNANKTAIDAFSNTTND